MLLRQLHADYLAAIAAMDGVPRRSRANTPALSSQCQGQQQQQQQRPQRPQRSTAAAPAAGEGLFTRNPNPLLKGKGTGRQLKFRALRVRAAVKGASVRLDLPPELFSSHSWRKAGLKQLGDNGASRKQMAARGSWKEDSVTMSRVYDEAHTAIIGPLGCLPEDYAARAAKELKNLRGAVRARAVRLSMVPAKVTVRMVAS
jgi:hypothetical protein